MLNASFDLGDSHCGLQRLHVKLLLVLIEQVLTGLDEGIDLIFDCIESLDEFLGQLL